MQAEYKNIPCKTAAAGRSPRYSSNARLVSDLQNGIIQFGNTPSAMPSQEMSAQERRQRVADAIRSVIQAAVDSGTITRDMIFISPSGYTGDTLTLLRRYLTGGLVLYRASSQMLFNFPQDSAYLDIHPKGPKRPGTDPNPDFEANDTNWTPFTSDINIALAAMGFGKDLVRQYLSSGAIDPGKPLYIIQQITVRPPVPIAFAMDGEVQIKGVLKADCLHSQYMLDDAYPAIADLTIREMLGVEGPVPPFKQTEYDKIHRPGYERPEFLK